MSKAGIEQSLVASDTSDACESQSKQVPIGHSSRSETKDTNQKFQDIGLENDESNRLSSTPPDPDSSHGKKRLPGPRKSVSFADGTKTTSNHKRVVLPGSPLLPHSPKNKASSEDKSRLQNDAICAILATDSLTDKAKNKAITAVLKKNGSQPLSTQSADESWEILKEEPSVKLESTNGTANYTDENVPRVTADEKAETVPEMPFKPVIPADEPPEDAALRRQMIQYNMEEVGAVVAELDLDEGGISYSEDDGEEYADDNSSVEEEEDRFGRTKRHVLTDDYLAEMKALEKRLKNVGPKANLEVFSPPIEHGDEQQPINGTSLNVVGTALKPAEKKGVRFAPELDIQEAPSPSGTDTSQKVEESTVLPKANSNPVLASVIERPFNNASATDNSTNTPAEPDEYDPALVQQEVATEYHKMRNRMIQRQGGFMAQDDSEKAEVPLTEAEGGPKKMSRFKAARLGKA